jgi:quercetin dioxygenase-like cupin family protein
MPAARAPASGERGRPCPPETQHSETKLEILPKQPTTKAPDATFTGDAWYDIIAQGTEPSRIRVNVVRFAPGARNAWHSHARGQTLHVIEGIGFIQPRGGEVTVIRPGDTIYTPRGNGTGTAPPRITS